MLNTTTPLVSQVLLRWLTNSYVYFHANEEERTGLGLKKPQGIGYGIGLAFAVFAMQGGPPLVPRVIKFLHHYRYTEISSLVRCFILPARTRGSSF